MIFLLLLLLPYSNYLSDVEREFLLEMLKSWLLSESVSLTLE